MIIDDKQVGRPAVLFKDTKTNIEALTNVEEGSNAYATDVDRFGIYMGTSWQWLDPAKCGCVAYNNTGGAGITHTSTGYWQVIALNAESRDVYPIGSSPCHDTSTNNTRIYARKTGVYLISAKLAFKNTSTSGIRGLAVGKNSGGVTLTGANIIMVDSRPAISTDTGTLCSDLIPLTDGDYVELWGWQNSGGNLGYVVSAYSPFLSIEFLTL